jgi:hypothetical protein
VDASRRFVLGSGVQARGDFLPALGVALGGVDGFASGVCGLAKRVSGLVRRDRVPAGFGGFDGIENQAVSLSAKGASGKRRVRRDPATMNPEERAAYETRRANNAFLKLRPISDELASFMGLPAKSERSQTDVTKFVATYVKAHSCFDPSFKRRIVPDTKLTKLLRVKDGQEVTYLNLQSFLKVHFLKVDAPKTA